jgi:hypothetical protein
MLNRPTRIVLTAFCALYVFAVILRVNPWTSRRRDRLRNPIAIAAWALSTLTVAAIFVAIWSTRAATWFGHVIDAVARRMIR